MLRAVRFACRLDFMIEPETKRALADCAPLLDAVARERVGIELEGILSTGHGETPCCAIPSSSAPPCPSWQRVAGLINEVSIMRLTSTSISLVF